MRICFKGIRYAAAIAAITICQSAHAWFFIIPIPNFAKPPTLSNLIDVLEKSDETKAVAYAREDKTFGTKYWVWGHYAGHVSQSEADSIALNRCQAELEKAKAQSVGGKPLYDFGNRSCELHSFTNKTVSKKATPPQPASPEPSNTAPPPTTVQSNPQDTSAEKPSPQSETAPPTNDLQQSTLAEPAPQTQPSVEPLPEPKPVNLQHPKQVEASDTPSARKLRELNQLRKEGLITEQEFNEKRKAILKSL